MIKPETLYNFGKTCRDPLMVGHVLQALCRQEVELTEMERTFFDMIRNDNEWMEERVEAKRAKERERQKAHRAKLADVTPVTDCHCDKTLSRDVTVTNRCHAPTNQPSQPIKPTNQPNHPTQHINRTDPDKINEPVKGVVGGRGASGSASGSGRYKFGEVFGWDDERLFSCDYGKSNVLEMYRCAFGKGMWAGALRELGDDAMLAELSAMCHEERAGEGANNPAAAMTERLKKLLAAKGVKA